MSTDMIIDGFKLSGAKWLDISPLPEVPTELQNEDVYCVNMLFKSEDIAIKYCLEHSKKPDTYERIHNALHEDDAWMTEGDVRSAEVYVELHATLTELSNGIFILWEAY